MNVLNNSYDRMYRWARVDEYQHLMTDSPAARQDAGLAAFSRLPLTAAKVDQPRALESFRRA
jgi:hypothetical protein